MKYDAKIDNIPIQIETIEDSFSKAIILHEYPGQDGSYNEDLGQKARTIRLKAWFINELYPKHLSFIQHLSKNKLFELYHPIYGKISGNIKNVIVRHSDLINACEIEFDFVENKRAEISIDVYIDILQSISELYAQGQYEIMDAYRNELKNKLPLSIIEKSFDSSKSIIEQISSATSTVRNEILKIDKYISMLESTLNLIKNPANSIISMINYTNDIPGRVMKALASCIERYAIAWNNIVSSPESFLNSFSININELINSFGEFGKYVQAQKSYREALEIATVYKYDEDRRDRLRNKEINENEISVDYLLTEKELINSYNVIRNDLEITKNNFREFKSIEKIGNLLLYHVNKIKLEYENTYMIYVEEETPLHLILHKNNLSYKYADRIIALNNISNPNFIKGYINIYYAR